ncbi:MAG TPA: amidohydrolase [Clostridia bacterium]|nr:amidohydrolase [Clostridia bacterium]
MVTNFIKQKAEELKPVLVELRRKIHAHPELGFEEEKTAALIAETLQKLEFEVQTGIAKTGVVGLLRGEKAGKTIAFRADMDALALQEENDKPYASLHPGKMHACGHDAHTTSLLGAAMILKELQNNLPGNIKFIFQPAEESTGGAKPMIEEGVLANPQVDAIFAPHVWPDYPAGKITVQYGPTMAAPDYFEIEITGKSGHGALPHKSIDAIIVACQVVNSLQTIVSRKRDPLDPLVLSIGTIQGGSAFNVIADRVKMTGTVRTFNLETREKMPLLMEEIISGICKAFGADYKFKYEKYFPPTINDEKMTAIAEKSAAKIVGKENVIVETKPSMGGEDFSFFLQEVPGSYIKIGINNPAKGIIYPLHHPKFDLDEDVLPITAALMAQIAWDFLQE